uniref:Uncharacterized protein n=1 Tax=Aegilops tauschii subsp. strangulata TaxID=200361 RepID=A0A453EID7_AEGTS
IPNSFACVTRSSHPRVFALFTTHENVQNNLLIPLDRAHRQDTSGLQQPELRCAQSFLQQPHGRDATVAANWRTNSASLFGTKATVGKEGAPVAQKHVRCLLFVIFVSLPMS